MRGLDKYANDMQIAPVLGGAGQRNPPWGPFSPKGMPTEGSALGKPNCFSGGGNALLVSPQGFCFYELGLGGGSLQVTKIFRTPTMCSLLHARAALATVC